MRVPIIAGNWKMNTTVAEAAALVRDMLPALERFPQVERVVCPPFVSLAAVRALLEFSEVKLGAQNMYFRERGAYTGEIAPTMLAGLVEYVILGHSERRQYFGESDELVNAKVKAALSFGLKPIVCVGETLEQREAGQMREVVTRQTKEALRDVQELDGIVVAYEPIWAIGTGRAATGEMANETISIIREAVASVFGKQAGDGIRIQYGGSVTASNIAEFVSQPDIDGALVGGASLKAQEFAGIVEQTAAARVG